MRRVLVYTPAFVRAAKRLAKMQPQTFAAVREVLERLEANAFEPRLRTHKLKGQLAGSWACSGGYDLRIVFEIVENGMDETIFLMSLGTHDEVY